MTAHPSWQTGSNPAPGSVSDGPVSDVLSTHLTHRPVDHLRQNHPPVDHPPVDRRPSAHGLRGLLGVRGLRTLIGVRGFASFGDGAFQGALASLVLFDPSSQSSPGTIAAAVTVLLLPYSIIGPFAGALLDRWSRRQVILWANVLRSVAIGVLAVLLAVGIPTSVLLIIALVVTGAGRFVGSGLSAALPHVIAQDSLVGANSLTTTIGSVSTAVGGGYALGLKSLVGSGNGAVAAVTATVIVFYVTASLLVLRFPAQALGPDETDEPPQPMLAVLQGFAAGFRHILQRPTVAVNIAMVVLVRFCFGMATLVVLLLFRHHFTDTHGIFKGGTAGITEVLGLAALGVFLGAVVTAPMVAWLGRTRYVAGLLSAAALVVVVSGLQFTQLSTMIATFVIAFAYQSSKICADTVVQSDSDDAHIGRVFALYDTASNIFYVAGFVLGVALVPDDGLSSPAVILIGVVFVLTSAVYGTSMRRCHGSWSGSPC